MGSRLSGRKPWYTFENKFEDLSGRKYGRWTVLRRADNTLNWNHIMWWCLCECGYEARVQGKSLRSGRSKSCGCLKTEKVKKQCQKQWDKGGIWREKINENSNFL